MIAPEIIVVAGPNGAGKSTSAPALLPSGVPYINADEIAKGIEDLAPGARKDVEASRRLLQEWDRFAEERTGFAIETTLASRSLAPKIRRLQAVGYRFLLYYFWLPNADLAVERVAERVRRGGHNIPEDVIRRRYEGGWSNFFEIYQPLADYWEVYANLARMQPIMMAQGKRMIVDAIDDPSLWQTFTRRTVMNENKVKETAIQYEPIWKAHQRGVWAAVRAAILDHKRAGNTIAIWRDDRVVLVPADEIEVFDDESEPTEH